MASSIYDRRGSSASATGRPLSDELDTTFNHLDPVGALFESDERGAATCTTATWVRPSRAGLREVLEQRFKEPEGATQVGARVEGGLRGPMGEWAEKELAGFDEELATGASHKKSTSRLRGIFRGPPLAFSPAKAKRLPPLPLSSTPLSPPRTTTSSLFRRSPAPSPTLSATFGGGTATTRLTLAQPLLSDDLDEHEELHITFPATSSASSSPGPLPPVRQVSRELLHQPSLPNLSALSLPRQNSTDLTTTPSSSTASLPHHKPRSSSWFRRQRKHESNASSGGQSYATASSISSLASLSYSVPTSSHSHSFSTSRTRSNSHTHSHSLSNSHSHSRSNSQSNSDSVGTFHRRKPSIPEAAFNALVSLGRRSKSDDLSDDELRTWKRNGDRKHVTDVEREVEMEVLEEYSDARDALPSDPLILLPLSASTPSLLADDLEASKTFRFPRPLPPTPPPGVAAADDESDVFESALAAAAFLSSTDPPLLSSVPLATSSTLPPRSPRRSPNRPKLSLSPTGNSGLNPPPRPRKSPARAVAPAPRRLISSSAWLQISLSASTNSRAGTGCGRAKVGEAEEAKVGEGEREEVASTDREEGGSETPPPSPPVMMLWGQEMVQNFGELAARREEQVTAAQEGRSANL